MGIFVYHFSFSWGGYGIYINSKEKNFNIIKKIKTLYICYGKVFLVFVPIAFAFFQNQPIYCQDEQICTRYSNFSITYVEFKVHIIVNGGFL